MPEPIRLRIFVDGEEVVTPAAVLSYDGGSAFVVGDVVNDAKLVARKWLLSGEGRFELALMCESEKAPVAGVMTPNGVIPFDPDNPDHIEQLDVAFPSLKQQRRARRAT